MKLRNRLLALFVLALFFSAGIVYFRSSVLDRPYSVILIVSDAVLPEHLAAARQFKPDHSLALDRFPSVAMVRNHSADYAVGDESAIGTTLATGYTGRHRTIGMTESGAPLKNLFDLARAKGRSVGLVTSGELTDPIPAAFYARTMDHRTESTLAQQFVNARIQVALGGGRGVFQRRGPDLLAGMAKERRIIGSKLELNAVDPSSDQPLVGLFSDGSMGYSGQILVGSEQPSLSEMVRQAMEVIRTRHRGYFLVVDGALVSHAAGANRAEQTLRETVAVDEAVATAVKFAPKDSLIVVVGKHGVGGFSMNGYPMREDSGLRLLGMNPQGYPSVTWATGPNGPEAGKPASQTEPAAAPWIYGLLTVQDVPVFARGEGAEKFGGTIELQSIFSILKEAL